MGIYKLGNAGKEIEKNKKFSINIPNIELEREFIKVGSSSGTNKLRESNLKYEISGKYNVPILSDCMLCMICEVENIVEQDNYFHIIGRIKERYLQSQFIKERKMNVGSFNPGRSQSKIL